MDYGKRLAFDFRRSVLGKIKLRRDLPQAVSSLPSSRGEVQFYYSMLSKVIPAKKAAAIDLVFDIGCRNWSYVQALAQFFPNAELVGVEVDGGRRYWNLHRRQDAAEAEATSLRTVGRQAHCIFDDFRNVDLKKFNTYARQVLFCFFFPFVSKHPCRRWGLPAEFADYGLLIKHMLSWGSELSIISCHQGTWEADIARQIYHQANLQIQNESVFLESEFCGLWPSTHDVQLIVSSQQHTKGNRLLFCKQRTK